MQIGLHGWWPEETEFADGVEVLPTGPPHADLAANRVVRELLTGLALRRRATP